VATRATPAVGNRLSAISDGSGDNSGVKAGPSSYSYDGNGNMTSDGNRGATITYKYLNLPKTVAIAASPAFTYDYNASGNKHKYVNSTEAFTSKYAGVFQYNGVNALKRAVTSAGQMIVTPYLNTTSPTTSGTCGSFLMKKGKYSRIRSTILLGVNCYNFLSFP
jgi:hypothetical protein